MRALVILGIVVALLLAPNMSFATSPEPSADPQVLDRLRGSEVPVQMNFRQVELGKVLEVLGRFGPFTVELELEVPSPSLLVVKARVKT